MLMIYCHSLCYYCIQEATFSVTFQLRKKFSLAEFSLANPTQPELISVFYYQLLLAVDFFTRKASKAEDHRCPNPIRWQISENLKKLFVA